MTMHSSKPSMTIKGLVIIVRAMPEVCRKSTALDKGLSSAPIMRIKAYRNLGLADRVEKEDYGVECRMFVRRCVGKND